MTIIAPIMNRMPPASIIMLLVMSPSWLFILIYICKAEDNHDGSYGIEDVNRIDHHRSNERGCLCQAVSTP